METATLVLLVLILITFLVVLFFGKIEVFGLLCGIAMFFAFGTIIHLSVEVLSNDNVIESNEYALDYHVEELG